MAKFKHMDCVKLILLFINVVVGFPKSSKDSANLWQSGGENVLTDILAATSQPECSAILFTDGFMAHLPIAKEMTSLTTQQGISVMEISLPSIDTDQNYNFTYVLESARHVLASSWCTILVVMSGELALLESFSEQMDKAHLVEWDTRLVVVTSLPQQDVKDLLQNQWTLSMMNAILVDFDDTYNQKCDVYSYLPYTREGPRVHKLASWLIGNGFIKTSSIPFFPEKYTNFYSSSVNMTVFPFPPYWMSVKKNAPYGSTIETLTGRDYIMLETAAQVLNFTINVLPDGEWDEVMKRLEDRTAYLSPIKLAIMPHLRKLYDFTLFIERATLGFSMAKPTLKPRWQSLYYPLRDLVWLSILAVLMLVPVMLFMVLHLGPTESIIRKRLSMGIIFLEVIGSLLGQTVSRPWPNTNSVRIVFGVWLIFSVIIGTAYRGNLTAFLTIPKYPDRPETVKQMVGVGATITMPPDLVDFYDSFKNSKSELFQTLAERVTFVPDFQTGMQQSIREHSAYLYERFYLELMIVEHFTETDGSTPLYVAQENILPGYCGWPMIRNAPFKPNFNKIIMSFHEAGLVRKWSSDILKQARLDSRKKQLSIMKENNEEEMETPMAEPSSAARGIMALTLTHMQGPIFLLSLGLFLSSMIFMTEALSTQCKKILYYIQCK